MLDIHWSRSLMLPITLLLFVSSNISGFQQRRLKGFAMKYTSGFKVALTPFTASDILLSCGGFCLSN